MSTLFTKIPSDFWTTPQAKALREAGVEANLLAMYLLTSPHANRLGIYYLPVAYICQDTHLPQEAVTQGLATLSRLNFCHYDDTTAYIWVTDMALYRVSRTLSPNDNQVKGIHRLYESLPKSLPFLDDFYQKYQSIFHFPAPINSSPFEGASKGVDSYKNKSKNKSKRTRHTLSGNPDRSGKPDGARDNFSNKQQQPSSDLPASDPPISNPPQPTTPEPALTDLPEKTTTADPPAWQDARAVLDFLNHKTGRAYRPVASNLQLIDARLRSGITIAQCRQVIAKKTRDWQTRADMAMYLRPATLFNATKFEQYLGELVLPSPQPTHCEESNHD